MLLSSVAYLNRGEHGRVTTRHQLADDMATGPGMRRVLLFCPFLHFLRRRIVLIAFGCQTGGLFKVLMRALVRTIFHRTDSVSAFDRSGKNNRRRPTASEGKGWADLIHQLY